MFYQIVLLMPILLSRLLVRAASNNETDGDVIVRYAGHAEANDNREQRIFVENNPVETITEGKALETKTLGPVKVDEQPIKPMNGSAKSFDVNNETESSSYLMITSNLLVDHHIDLLHEDLNEQPSVATVHEPHITKPSTEPTTPIEYMDETEGVVFVPNDAPTVRLEDEYAPGGLRIHDVIGKKTVYDVMNRDVHMETESPHEQVIFVPGSNNDNVDHKEKEEKSGRRNSDKVKEEKRVIYPQYKLDCSNLDCNNSMKSICGGKIVNRKLQYRLFLNDCYFRKVNCNFKYKLNRYTIVPSDKCAKYGTRGERPFTFSRRLMDTPTKQKDDVVLSKSFSSRRSMSMNVYGNFCSHPCPVTCPEDYEPQCAISSTGQRRVFMNHCKLDDNSCLFSIVWHMRPLSECVGGRKADMRQNRYFIGWMRQVGILDNKGKLVLQ